MAKKLTEAEQRQKRVIDDLARMRGVILLGGPRKNLIINKETLQFLLDAYDRIPDVLRGVGEDLDKCAAALREAGKELEKGL